MLIFLMGTTFCVRAESAIDSGKNLLNACKVASAALDGILKSPDIDDMAKTIECVAYTRGFADSYENTSSVVRFTVRSGLEKVATEQPQQQVKRRHKAQNSMGREVTDPVIITIFNALEALDRGLMYCIPKDVDNQALVRAIVRQGDVVPKNVLEMPPVFLADLAFLASFPCSKQRK